MKRNHIHKTSLTVLLSACGSFLHAQQSWVIAVVEDSEKEPVLKEYRGQAEKAENGLEYQRIFDHSYKYNNEPYNPEKQPYGFRWADKKLYVYDFDMQKETVAMDFSLEEGDSFTTINGIEWVVASVKDTLVNTSFCGQGENTTKRLLDVKSTDGKVADQWLEDFGSFRYHFLINSIEGIRYSQTLWMEYDLGEYLAREINADPFFSHDSGWMESSYGDQTDNESTKCVYENGKVVIESIKWGWEHRDYSLFYREDDDIYMVYQWEMNPHVDGSESFLQKDVATLSGLPVPESGQYTVHVADNEYPTGVRKISSTAQPNDDMYDIKGHRVRREDISNGMLIWDGKKVLVK